MNLYGYAAGDPINNSDPFGLCPECPIDPKDEKGPIVAIAVSGGAALSTIGANFEAGIAINWRTKSFVFFAGAGNSMGVGASLGGEATVQSGTLRDFIGTRDMNQNASELEVGGLVGANLVLGADKSSVIGAGVNGGLGGGALWNLRAATVASPALTVKGLWERLEKSVPLISIAPHH
jgi:hypothetical protein